MKLEKTIYLFISLLTIFLPGHEYIYDSWVPIEMEFLPQKERQKENL